MTHLICRFAEVLELRPICAHVNHQLRGLEASRDEEFCVKFAHELGVDIEVFHVDVAGEAKAKGISVETAGRDVRYRVFREMAARLSATKIVTAHHLDDLAETMLMRLFTGAGVGAMNAIELKNGAIVRPMLEFTRQEIEEYACVNRLEFVTDSTNSDDDAKRNYIRNRIMPLIGKRFPAYRAKMGEFAQTVRDEEAFWAREMQRLDRYAMREDGRIRIAAKALNSGADEALIARWIRLILRECAGEGYTPNRNTILATMKGKTRGNRTLIRNKSVLVRRAYEEIIVEKPVENFQNTEIYVKLLATSLVTYCGKSINIEITTGGEDDPAMRGEECVFDAGNAEEMRIRRKIDGDRISIGAGQSKKLQDLFTDAKIDRSDRKGCFIVEIGGETVAVYIPGYGFRVSRQFYVGAGSRRICRLSVKDVDK